MKFDEVNKIYVSSDDNLIINNAKKLYKFIKDHQAWLLIVL